MTGQGKRINPTNTKAGIKDSQNFIELTDFSLLISQSSQIKEKEAFLSERDLDKHWKFVPLIRDIIFHN